MSAALRSSLRVKEHSVAGHVTGHSVAHFAHSSARASSHTAGMHGSSAAHHESRHAARAVKPRVHGQQGIDSARTLEIQQALIREKYLTVDEATGQWDQATREALIRLQNDNHWQTKILPDARALIKLGLGPSQQNLLNPETAAVAMPYPSRAATQGNAN